MFAIRRLLLLCTTASIVIALGACGSDSEGSTGAASPEALIEAHIEASRTYDLAAGCALFTPERREQMASFDGEDPEGYCERATQEVIDNADDAARARTAEIYTDPGVVLVSEDGDRHEFEITAADGSYREVVDVVEVDGRWWVGEIESDVDLDHDHDEDDGAEHGDEGDGG